ncbi:hypothetical protein BsWGS_18331 [Bradybaena similaris]
MRGRKELIEHYDPAQSSFIIKHREETRNIKTYFITGRKPGNEGIPGLDALADERPEHLRRERERANRDALDNATAASSELHPEGPRSLPNDTENIGAAAADLFSQRIPDIMTDTDTIDTQDKAGDEQESGADSTLLKQNRTEAVTEEQDRLLVSLIAKENDNNKSFFKPNLNKLCLTFKPEMESMYRHEYKDSHLFQENMLSSPRYQTAAEAGTAVAALLLLAICCHIMFHAVCTTGLIVVTVAGLLLEALVFLDALTNIIYLETKKTSFPTLLNVTLNWYFRNALGVIMATIPSLLVYISFSCDLAVSHSWRDRFFCFSIVVALLQYCNYSMMRSYAKTVMAILVGSVLIILLFVNFCPQTDPLPTVGFQTNISYNQTVNNDAEFDQLFSGENTLRFEIILSTLLLLFLVFILNYEFENSYRLSFNASVKAQKDKENMQLNKDQADWLLHNIIPAHLAELFKTNRSYSRNHQDVGVIFATIVNFNEFYDEMYAGGREYLRVLNELVSDYEVMLSEPRFKDVEKIKTISSSFMAASGLNEESRAKNKHPYAHLFALMEFAMELEVVVARFNESIFNFSFILNIGYNYGPVTAGVIGTTKLLYDIWGDAVNIASRMYSTGEDNRIQVPQATADLLSEMFEFSYRDEIAVKGKGVMKTYLLENKKPGAKWE